jgi:hypothetical protein
MNPVQRFEANVAEVERLVSFDKEVLQVAIMAIQDLHDQLKTRFADERLNGGRALTIIRGIRDNDSLRPKYEAINGQAVVLLVSHFSSALGDLFREAVSVHLRREDAGSLLDEELKLTIRELRERDFSLAAAVPEMLIAKHDYTFQDMASTLRAFKTYAGVEHARDIGMNNIITAQACRHAIVHAGGRANERTVKQISKAYPRELKPALQVGEVVRFSSAEVTLVKDAMISFIEKTSAAIV